MWPGLVAGEWHNNHHLFPNGAKSGFLPYQVDLPWLFIRGLHRIGVVRSYRDYQAEFDALPCVQTMKTKGRRALPAELVSEEDSEPAIAAAGV
jgi:stearoyl-CoA desaturase (delta-9 desaturase)